MEHELDGWDIVHGADADWMPWGGEGAPARAKVLGTGDGYALVVVEAAAGQQVVAVAAIEAVAPVAAIGLVVAGKQRDGVVAAGAGLAVVAAGAVHRRHGRFLRFSWFVLVRLGSSRFGGESG